MSWTRSRKSSRSSGRRPPPRKRSAGSTKSSTTSRKSAATRVASPFASKAPRHGIPPPTRRSIFHGAKRRRLVLLAEKAGAEHRPPTQGDDEAVKGPAETAPQSHPSGPGAPRGEIGRGHHAEIGYESERGDSRQQPESQEEEGKNAAQEGDEGKGQKRIV